MRKTQEVPKTKDYKTDITPLLPSILFYLITHSSNSLSELFFHSEETTRAQAKVCQVSDLTMYPYLPLKRSPLWTLPRVDGTLKDFW